MDQLHVVGQTGAHTIGSGVASQGAPVNAHGSEKATIGSFLPSYPNQPENNQSAPGTEEKEARRQVFTQDGKTVAQVEDRADQFFLTGVNVTTQNQDIQGYEIMAQNTEQEPNSERVKEEIAEEEMLS